MARGKNIHMELFNGIAHTNMHKENKAQKYQSTIADFIADNAIVTWHYQQILGNLLQLFLVAFVCRFVPPWLTDYFV